ncbi:hypothetical protein ACUN0C_09110 [Faunimonas sp. B44]|uniref:hypothetical protein n=1 Tax=Faunimonas sp. B44 TaxID=3461493 RepID=UPI004044A618
MADRLESLERIVGLQRQLHRMAEWRLAELERRRAENDEAQRVLVEALGGDAALHGLFVAPMASRLRSLAVEGERIGRDVDRCRAELLDVSRRLKQAERVAAALAVESLRKSEAEQLREVIEQCLSAGPASLP